MIKSLKVLALTGGIVGWPLVVGALAGDSNSRNSESKKSRETSMSFLNNGVNSYQFNIESKAPSSLGFHYGGSYSNYKGDSDFLINFGLAGSIRNENFLLSPYLFGSGSLDFSGESMKHDNVSFGIKFGYDISKTVNLGLDLRRTNYINEDLEDSFFQGIFIKISPDKK